MFHYYASPINSPLFYRFFKTLSTKNAIMLKNTPIIDMFSITTETNKEKI